MARAGKITLKTGKGKESGKPWAGLLLEVGTWSELYFPKSKFEMEYLEKYLSGTDESKDDGKIDLNDDDTPKKGKGLFN